MAAPPSGDTSRTEDDPDDDLDLAAAWRPLVRGAREPRSRRRLGGDLVVSALFGSLVAAGMTWLLITLVAGLASALGMPPGLGGDVTAAGSSGAVSLISRSALLGTVLLAFVSGGYVAARLSRAGGPLLGLGVWAWAQVIAMLVVSLGATGSSAGAVPPVLGGQSGPGVVDWNVGAVGVMTVLAMMVTALAGAWCGSTLGTGSWRRVARFRTVR